MRNRIHRSLLPSPDCLIQPETGLIRNLFISGSWRSARTWQRRRDLRLDRLSMAGSIEQCNSCRYKAHNQCNDQETPDRHRFGLRCFRSLHGPPAFSATTMSSMEWVLVGSAGVYVEGVGVTFGSIPAATASIRYWDAFGLQKFATFDWPITLEGLGRGLNSGQRM
jgi:hypothetical protein